MKMHIREFAKLAGVTVRTLHYYDGIGLLKPCAVDEQNGYRYYNEENLARMQEILFYRELDFSLSDISVIMLSPEYDRRAALREQKELLILKKQRLERLITALDGAMKGEDLSMNIFDNSEFEAQREKYAEEAKKRWENTPAYAEYTEKSSDRTAEKNKEVNIAMDNIMTEFAKCMQSGNAPESTDAQALVKKWQDFITKNHYTCTKEILAGLGEMYVGDERFKANIDRHGIGTAEFMSDAIKAYCG